jgi:ribosomal protein L35
VRFGSRKAGSNGFKTKSAVKKRFRVTGGGALKRLSSGKRHLNLHKSSARIHRLGASLCQRPLPSALLLPGSPPAPLPCPTGAQKTIKNKGLRKRYLRVFGLSPFTK